MFDIALSFSIFTKYISGFRFQIKLFTFSCYSNEHVSTTQEKFRPAFSER